MSSDVEKSKFVSVRLGSKDYELLKRVSQARGIDISAFVREAIRREFARLSYLNDETKKAFGLEANSQLPVAVRALLDFARRQGLVDDNKYQTH
jgi:post-segregation antitoxin (ccd killing protein)